MTHQEIENIINKVVASQMYDAMFDTEKEELANEAWLAVLDAIGRGTEMTEPLCYFIAKVAIIHFKYWRRLPVSVPKECSHRYVKSCAESMKPAPEGAIDKVTIPSLEEEVDLKILLERFTEKLNDIDKLVFSLLMNGYTSTEVWKELESKGIKNAKRISYDFKKNKAIWNVMVRDK